AGRAGYIDFGPDYDKVRILSTWTQYRGSGNGDQTPYVELWRDDDIDGTNDSELTVTSITFNSAVGLNTGSTTPWVQDSDVSSNPVIPQARYLILRAPDPITKRAMEYAIVGWIDENDNGIQDVPASTIPVSQITISS